MDIILWRHAEANPAREGLDDLQRPLTPKGERQARRMAEWLDHRLPHSTRILVSPAMRAQQTARSLERKFKTVDALRAEAPAEDLLEAARWPASNAPVLIVAHQPALGMVAALLLAGTKQPWAVKKGAVWWLRQQESEVGARVVVHAVQSPDGL